MNWYVVNKDYINYLIQFDSRVGYVEYGEKLKLHVGILLFLYHCIPIKSEPMIILFCDIVGNRA